MKIIVNTDRNWAIGHEGELLFPIPADLKYFRDTTMGKVVVMGRKTLLSLPGGKPLPGRVNIVFTRGGEFVPEDVVVCKGLDCLAEALGDYPSDDVYIIGGEEVYRMMLDYCDTALVTRVDAAADRADSYFPNLDTRAGWQLANPGEPQQHEGLNYAFCTYENTQVQPLPGKM